MRSRWITIFCLLLFPASLVLAAVRSDVADAVMKGDKATLRVLLQRKADVNAAQADGATALHWAVYRDDLESVDALINAGAKPDAKNREGVTPLHMASLYGNAKIVASLLKGGADAKQKGQAIEVLAPPELEKWRQRLTPVTDEWIAKADKKGLDGRKLLDDFRAIIKSGAG